MHLVMEFSLSENFNDLQRSLKVSILDCIVCNRSLIVC